MNKILINTNDYLINKYGSGSPKIVPGMIRYNLYQLFTELGYTVGCEVGVEKGKNAQTMFEIIPNLKLYVVDSYKQHPQYNYAAVDFPHHWNKHNLLMAKRQAEKKMQGRNAVIIEKFSDEAVQDIPYDSLDFVYIDGGHSYDYVMTDIILWTWRVRPGGIVSGHDYISASELNLKLDINVQQAVNDYISVHKIDNWFLTDKTRKSNHNNKCPSWFFVKK